MMIRRAVEQDLDAVEQSYTELLTYEAQHGGHSNWVLNVYPTRETAKKACLEEVLYVMYEEDELCASMILNQVQLADYQQIPWKYPAKDEEVAVIHTLCIPPSKAGNGYGKQMVAYALEKAKEWGLKAIRLDTFAGNKPAASLYEKLGFRYAGTATVLFQGAIPEDLIFFEKQIEGER